MGWVIASPAVQNGVVYFPRPTARASRRSTPRRGALKFNIENKAVRFSSPALVNDVAYFGSSDGWLHAVDIEDRRDEGRIPDGRVEGERVEVHRRQGPDDRFRSLSRLTLDGMIIGMDRMYALGSILSSPVVRRRAIRRKHRRKSVRDQMS